MKYKNLGNTEKKIPVIGQGCMGIGGEFHKDSLNDRQQVDALKLGIDCGMTLIDTAEVYGAGHSEEVVGKAIKGIRQDVFIATKFSPNHHKYDDVIDSAQTSLGKIGTNYIDLYQVHWPNPSVPIEETMRALEDLVRQGKVRYIGLSNFSKSEMQDAQSALGEAVIVSNQVEYNLFDRFIENSLLPFCEETQVSIIAYSPLDKGKISGKWKKLEEIAGRYGKTAAQVALNWLTDRPNVVAIPKATNPAHIKENATATDFELSEDDKGKIDIMFQSQPDLIPTQHICVVPNGEGNRKVYQTLDEAKENRLGLAPSPSDLADDVIKGEAVKPVRITLANNSSGPYKYNLIEGRVRYWAWVIAYKGEKPIPAYIRK